MPELKDALGRPAGTYRPVVAYGLNGDLKDEKLAKRIAWFKEIGYGGMLLIAEPGLPYGFMDDAWLDKVAVILEQAKQNGLDVWVWDDWVFPSGFGGGLVTANPDYRARKLQVAVDMLLEPGQSVSLATPERALAAGAVRVNKYAYYSPAGEWKPLQVTPGDKLTYQAGGNRERFVLVTWEYISFHEIATTGNYAEDASVCTVDMLNPQATRRFLEVVHERYARRFQADFGGTFKGFFYDEPELPYAFPWTKDFATQFQARKGYNLLERLPLMMVYLPMAYMGLGGPVSAVQTIEGMAKDYFDVWTDLVAENFYGELEKWCHAHSVLSTGHQDMDNKMNTLASVSGHFFKNSQHNDHPGIDVIWEHVAPGRLNDFPRYAGSVARLFGKERAMSEDLAEMGAGMHNDATRFILEQQLIRNVSQFFMCTSAYQAWKPKKAEVKEESGGKEKEVEAELSLKMTTDIELLPRDLSPENPVLAAFGAELHERIGRMSTLVNVGVSLVETALYLPMLDINLEQGRLAHPHTSNTYPAPWDFTNRIVEHLVYLPIEFDYLWDEAILTLEIQEGFRAKSGNVIRTLILPPRVTLRPEVVEKLRAFCQAGGKLLMVEEPAPALEHQAVFCVNIENLDAHLGRRVTIKPDGLRISLAGRRDNRYEIYLLLNEERKARQVTLGFKGQGQLLELDATSGRLTMLAEQVPAEYKTWLDATASRVFIIDSSCELPAQDALAPIGKALAVDTWKLTLPDGKVVNLSGVLPDWQELGFPNYSGWMSYQTAFNWDGPETTALLDLGEVCYSAEVYIDQVKVGTAPFRPYQVTLEGLAAGLHHLEVRLLNSLANQSCGSRERELAVFGSGTHPLVVADRRKTRSGLMGPVKIERLGKK